MNKLFLFAGSILLLLSSCNKKENFAASLPVLSDYNLQTPGKYITYQLDSLLFVKDGTQDTIVNYFARDLVDTTIVIDNLGRPAHLIIHSLSQSETGPWQPDNTFLTVTTTNSVEFIENNFRFIKLQEPIQNDFSWKGNEYIETSDANAQITNVADWDYTYLDGWDYTYANVGQLLTIGSLTFDSTVTVNERDETIGDTTDVNSYSEKNYSIEQYAKGIGLVYRNFLHRVYQPPTSTESGYSGYGVTITILDHN